MKTAAWILALWVTAAAAQVKVPKAPPKLCIGDDPAACAQSEREGVKWHPGHYMLTPSVDSYSASHILALKDEPLIAGVQHRVTWGSLEPFPGVYDFSRVEALLKLCESAGKRLVLQVMERRFGEGGSIAPSDITVLVSGIVTRAPIWEAPTADRYYALLAALAQRFDAEPAFTGLIIPETSAPNPLPAGYSKAQHAQEIKRLLERTTRVWRKTVVFLFTNYLTDQIPGLYESLYQVKAGGGGPDTLPPPHRDTVGSRTLRGIEPGSLRDYRGLVPVGYAVQGPELCGKEGCFLPQQLLEHAVDTHRATHLFWLRNGAQRGEAYSWDAMLRVIRAEGGRINRACPRQWSCAP